jgi:uncharacterized protein
VKRDVVIIHGATSKPEEHWFPWLAQQVECAGHNALVPRFPTPEGQAVVPWLEVLDSALSPLGPSTSLVGHSLGSALMLRALERPGPAVEASVFVSGFAGLIGDEFFDSLNAPFLLDPFDWEAIRARAGKVRLFAGSDDPFVPLSKGEELAEHLDAELTVVPGGGHLISQFGYTQFPQLWDALQLAWVDRSVLAA